MNRTRSLCLSAFALMAAIAFAPAWATMPEGRVEDPKRGKKLDEEAKDRDKIGEVGTSGASAARLRDDTVAEELVLKSDRPDVIAAVEPLRSAMHSGLLDSKDVGSLAVSDDAFNRAAGNFLLQGYRTGSLPTKKGWIKDHPPSPEDLRTSSNLMRAKDDTERVEIMSEYRERHLHAHEQDCPDKEDANYSRCRGELALRKLHCVLTQGHWNSELAEEAAAAFGSEAAMMANGGASTINARGKFAAIIDLPCVDSPQTQ